ncbi:MAG: hypothetical protein A3E79_16070 [Burkholderiales bacterium RIFCSPHIGHO2_12_FULL_61_11]|nr:MAG: hypothetical protein A3E79_16070 [Burkholderiales bacterium RIFCSPHIGHO2_12_FULL_61_11]
MKIEYDINRYREIANLDLNEIVQVANRKGIKSSIHIQNITKLSWRELQLLMPDGENRFSKMVLLYNRYHTPDSQEDCHMRGERLTALETEEISDYIKLYQDNSFSRHFEVNQYISDNNFWGRFPTIRSLNDHGNYKEIHGIQPKYFEVVCRLLAISGEGGLPLDAYKKY